MWSCARAWAYRYACVRVVEFSLSRRCCRLHDVSALRGTRTPERPFVYECVCVRACVFAIVFCTVTGCGWSQGERCREWCAHGPFLQVRCCCAGPSCACWLACLRGCGCVVQPLGVTDGRTDHHSLGTCVRVPCLPDRRCRYAAQYFEAEVACVRSVRARLDALKRKLAHDEVCISISMCGEV